jgi:hypothetical protein
MCGKNDAYGDNEEDGAEQERVAVAVHATGALAVGRGQVARVHDRLADAGEEERSQGASRV